MGIFPLDATIFTNDDYLLADATDQPEPTTLDIPVDASAEPTQTSMDQAQPVISTPCTASVSLVNNANFETSDQSQCLGEVVELTTGASKCQLYN